MAQPMTTSDDFPLDKFIKLLNMLRDTTSDNEKIAAIRLCNAMLARNGLDWEKFARSKITIVNDPFGSIPEPPKAQAAPQPTAHAYQPAPPSQRRRQDAAKVDSWITTLTTNRHDLATWYQQRLDTIVIDWQHHSPMIHDTDYQWLDNRVTDFIPQRRDPDLVRQFLDTADFASLSRADTARVNRIRQAWGFRGDPMIHNKDYDFLRHLHQAHQVPPKKGKANRRI